MEKGLWDAVPHGVAVKAETDFGCWEGRQGAWTTAVVVHANGKN